MDVCTTPSFSHIPPSPLFPLLSLFQDGYFWKPTISNFFFLAKMDIMTKTSFLLLACTTTRPVLATSAMPLEVLLKHFKVKLSLYSQLCLIPTTVFANYKRWGGQIPGCYLVDTSAILVGWWMSLPLKIPGGQGEARPKKTPPLPTVF